MVDPHTASAIAQIVLYIPVVPIAIYLLIRNWRYGPRTAWYPTVPLSLIRLIGGILTIVVEQGLASNNPPNKTLIIVTIVFLNIGLIPLILSLAGLNRLVYNSSLKGDELKRYQKIGTCIRYGVIAAAVLLSVSGGFAGQPDKEHTQKTLSIVAYIVFAVLVVVLVAVSASLYLRDKAAEGYRIYLEGALISSVFVGIRAVYGLLGVFLASGEVGVLTSIWSPLFGSAVAFSLMALVPEYIALWIYIFLSVHRLKTCSAAELLGTDREMQALRG